MNLWILFVISNSFTALGSINMHLGWVDKGSGMAFGISYLLPVWLIFFISGMGVSLCV